MKNRKDIGKKALTWTYIIFITIGVMILLLFFLYYKRLISSGAFG
jgi:hypothetical protein